MVAGALTGFGVAEGTAKLLSQSPLASRFAVLVHSETGFAERIAGRELGGIFGVALVERDHSVAVVKILHRVVNVFFVSPRIS